MAEPDAPPVLVERADAITTITLNRPQQRNALNFAVRQGLRDAFDSFDADPSQRCAVVTGAGTVFCAGMDLKEMSAGAVTVPPAEWLTLLGSSGTLSKPVIAAVNGPAFAGGFLIAQDCDLVIAAQSAHFGITEVKRGRGAPWATPLIDILPRRIMAELLLTGEPISAQRAYEVGLVNHVVPDDELLDRAHEIAAIIAANAPLSVQAGKRTVRLAAALGAEAARDPADWLWEHVYRSADAQEGPRAFVEKRAPRWQGR